ncbi:response regulator transcription factor [Bacillus sp. NP157]|nr:response regulator transcription factor [Bacillus sp. NP157]
MSGKHEESKQIRVLITDDHPVMRHGLRAAVSVEPDMGLAGEASNGREAVDKYRELRPDVVLMDLQMPGMDGLEAISTIRAEFPDANIIVLTSYPGDARIMRALMLGATSYLLKSASLDEIIRAIRSSLVGRHVVHPDAAHDLARHAGSEALTDKEISVLKLVANGQSNKAIAQALSVSEETVKSRLHSITGKLGALDRTHAVMIAIQRGFLQP